MCLFMYFRVRSVTLTIDDKKLEKARLKLELELELFLIGSDKRENSSNSTGLHYSSIKALYKTAYTF